MMTAMGESFHTNAASSETGMTTPQMLTRSSIIAKRVSPPPRMMPVLTGI